MAATTASPLPSPFLSTSPTAPPTLITQGAESHLYLTTYLLPSLPAALKSRPRKPYRHPTLDARLTRHRLLTESRCLARCHRAGVRVPAVYAVGVEEGWLMMEWIAGGSLRQGLEGWLVDEKKKALAAGGEGEEGRGGLRRLMWEVGAEVGKMHLAGVVHGDLTTSNILFTPTTAREGDREGHEGVVTLIDFGLAAQSVQDEDRAVDLYVLERAFISTHPKAEGLFEEVLKGYEGAWEGGKGGGVVLKRLETVRMRGRKRSMLG